MMIEELDTVVLTRAVEEHSLAAGDLGTVVFRYPEGEAFEVEFITAEGDTIAVLTLDPSDIRPLADGEILHARKVGS